MPAAIALALRTRIEAALANRVPGALTLAPRIARQGVVSGIEAVDKVLPGGLSCGVITELVGSECSGRTSLAFAYMSAVIRLGNVCAWIDTADRLCPESAATNAVDLERLLWVRCGSGEQKPFRVAVPLEDSSQKPTAGIPMQARPAGGGGSPHPRSEGRNMPEAIGALLQAHGGMYNGQVRREKKMIGTPGAPNRPVMRRPQHREEQVNSDRLPPRRGDNLTIAPRCAEPQPRRMGNVPERNTMLHEKFKSGSNARINPWQALDQAIRATDLLLQSGGFSVVVLDLASIPPEIAWRIPLATWFRFRAACDRTRTSLLLLTQHACARSSAELVVRLQAGSIEAQSEVMTGIRYGVATERSRSDESANRVVPIRKPPQPERLSPDQPGQWRSEAVWAQLR